MISAANDTSIFQIWADMVCYDESRQEKKECSSVCIFTAQRKENKYRHTYEEIMSKYAKQIVQYEELAPAVARAMGDYAYMAKFDTREEAVAFSDYVIEQ